MAQSFRTIGWVIGIRSRKEFWRAGAWRLDFLETPSLIPEPVALFVQITVTKLRMLRWIFRQDCQELLKALSVPRAEFGAIGHCDAATNQDDPKQQSTTAAVMYRHVPTITRAARLTVTRDGARQPRPRVVDHYSAISSSGRSTVPDKVMHSIARSAFPR